MPSYLPLRVQQRHYRIVLALSYALFAVMTPFMAIVDGRDWDPIWVLLPLVCAIGLYVVAWRARYGVLTNRNRLRELLIEPPGFVVPGASSRMAVFVQFYGWFLVFEGTANYVRIGSSPFAALLVIPGAALLSVPVYSRLRYGPQVIELTPVGVRFPGVLRRPFVRWDDIETAFRYRIGARLAIRTRDGRSLTATSSLVDEEFLMTVILAYAANPDLRDGIGTAEAAEQLSAGFVPTHF